MKGRQFTDVHGHKGVIEASDNNHGKGSDREIFVYHGADGKTHSTNAARAQKEKSLGHSLPKGEEVDHKDNDHTNNSSSNLQVLGKSENIAKEDRDRGHKKKHRK